MKHYKSIEKFREKFYLKFPNKTHIEIIKFLENRYVLVKDYFGECSMYRSNLLKGDEPSILTAINKIEYYKNQFYSRFPNSEIEILDFSNRELDSNGWKGFVFIKTKYGVCEILKDRLLKGCFPSILSAVNQFEYLSNQIKEKHPELELIKILENGFVIVNNKYGLCKINKNDLIRKRATKPTIQSAINKNEYFINQAKEIHKDRYDYSLVEYKDIFKKVKIICKEHGVFEQTPGGHFRCNGCKKCKINYLKSCSPERFNTHKSEEWFEQAKNSKKFDSFKCYIIKCWNEEEEFFKIGKTFQKMEQRFQKRFTFSINYNYEILQIFEEKELTIENSKKISLIEKELQKMNIDKKYKPKIEFTGYNECFSDLSLKEVANVTNILRNRVVEII